MFQLVTNQPKSMQTTQISIPLHLPINVPPPKPGATLGPSRKKKDYLSELSRITKIQKMKLKINSKTIN
jgi:hypothetical protein